VAGGHLDPLQPGDRGGCREFLLTVTSAQVNEEEDGFDLVVLARLLWTYRILLIGSVLVCAIAAAVMALLAKPIYRAEAAVVEVREDSLGGMGGLANQLGGLAGLAGINLLGANVSDENYLGTLKSRRVSEEFIVRHKLQPILARDANPPPTLWKTVEGFRKGVLSINEDRRSGIVTVAIEWTDPGTAANWANQYVALANEVLRARALAESSRNVKYLNEQIAKTNVVEIQRVMYNLVESETKSLMLANARLEYAFRVIDPAVKPEMRVRPKRTVMVIIGSLLGGTLGLMLMFAHRLWKRLRAPSR
jgi:uncharacterized protein involved in exopolysaccharide biosynthesis